MNLDRFFALLRMHTPGTPVTRVLVALNVAVFLATALSAASLIHVPADVLSRWGGNYGTLTLSGQGWRLLTSIFLHGGLLHVALNMLALYQAGQLVERMFGSGRYLALYLGSGVLASLASVWWRQDVVSIGASGAIFGVFGGLLAFLLVHRERLPAAAFARLRAMTLSFVGYSLLLGFAIPGVDNAAHIGGVLGGIALGSVLSGVHRKRSMAGLAVLLLAAVVLWGKLERPVLPLPAVANVIDMQPQLAARELEIMEALRAGTASRAEVADVVEHELKPNWDSLIAGLQQAALSPDEPASALLDYARLERSALEALSLALTTGHPGWMSTAAMLRAEAQVSLSQYLSSVHGSAAPGTEGAADRHRSPP